MALAPHSLGLIEALATSRPVRIVDVGANPLLDAPPYAALLAAGACHVTGFEPQPEAFAALKDTDHARYLPYAIGAGGAGTLHLYKHSGFASLYQISTPHVAQFEGMAKQTRPKGSVPVETRSLDSLDELGAIDLLKLDVQGAECDVIRGGARSLAQAVMVIPEVRFQRLYKDEPLFADLDLVLRGQGFVLHKFLHISHAGYALPPGAPLRRRRLRSQMIDGDAVYIRDPALVAGMSDAQLRYLAILADTVCGSFDLTFWCLGQLAARGAIDATLAERYSALLPDNLKNDPAGREEQ